MTRTSKDDAVAPVLVPLAAHLRNMAVGFAIGSVLLVPERLVQWSLRDADNRISGGVLAAQLVGVPLLVTIGALVLRPRRPAARDRLFEVLGHAPPGSAISDPAEVRKLSRRNWMRVVVLWVLLGLFVPFMASSMVALAIFVGITAQTERGLDEGDQRQLLCRPRWFIWKPLAWRSVPAG